MCHCETSAATQRLSHAAAAPAWSHAPVQLALNAALQPFVHDDCILLVLLHHLHVQLLRLQQGQSMQGQ